MACWATFGGVRQDGPGELVAWTYAALALLLQRLMQLGLVARRLVQLPLKLLPLPLKRLDVLHLRNKAGRITNELRKPGSIHHGGYALSVSKWDPIKYTSGEYRGAIARALLALSLESKADMSTPPARPSSVQQRHLGTAFV